MTELDPVTLPTDESAVSSWIVATLLANVSGSDVPRATNEMAVTESASPIVHPKWEATSPVMAVRIPMKARET